MELVKQVKQVNHKDQELKGKGDIGDKTKSCPLFFHSASRRPLMCYKSSTALGLNSDGPVVTNSLPQHASAPWCVDSICFGQNHSFPTARISEASAPHSIAVDIADGDGAGAST